MNWKVRLAKKERKMRGREKNRKRGGTKTTIGYSDLLGKIPFTNVKLDFFCNARVLASARQLFGTTEKLIKKERKKRRKKDSLLLTLMSSSLDL